MIKVLECTECKDRHLNGYQCSECHRNFHVISERFKFCPDCGVSLGSWEEALDEFNRLRNLPKNPKMHPGFNIHGVL